MGGVAGLSDNIRVLGTYLGGRISGAQSFDRDVGIAEPRLGSGLTTVPRAPTYSIPYL